MGLALLAVIWLITLVSTYFFVAKTWWLPHGVSTAAPWIDHQFALTYILMGIIFLAAQLSLGYLVWKYRDRPSFGTGAICARQHDARNRVDYADGDSFHRVEPDGEPRLGVGAV